MTEVCLSSSWIWSLPYFYENNFLSCLDDVKTQSWLQNKVVLPFGWHKSDLSELGLNQVMGKLVVDNFFTPPILAYFWWRFYDHEVHFFLVFFKYDKWSGLLSGEDREALKSPGCSSSPLSLVADEQTSQRHASMSQQIRKLNLLSIHPEHSVSGIVTCTFLCFFYSPSNLFITYVTYMWHLGIRMHATWCGCRCRFA